MSKPTPTGASMSALSRTLILAFTGTVVALVLLAQPLAAHAIDYPPNYDPMLVISDANWRDSRSMDAAEVQAFLEAQNGVLKAYRCAEGGPHNTHSTVIKPASQIIAEAAVYYNVNPKLIIATLEKEQSLISQPWHSGRDIDPASTHNYSTEYHLTNAMGAGVYSGSTDRHPGFGDQVWEGARLLGLAPDEGSTSPYRWFPGKTRVVYSYEHATNIVIMPLNQPTWNFYTYTPYYPQISVWRQYDKFFGDPLVYPGQNPVYRFYNKVNGSHFYTASERERATVMAKWSATYRYEGAAYSLDSSSGVNTQPLYRFYNVRNGTHFYTASEVERDAVKAKWPTIYSYEGPAYNVSPVVAGCAPVYRFYNKRIGSHFYTVSAAERDMVNARWSNVYTDEGIAYYVALSN